ncbi:MAG: ribonuclease Z [Aerococcus suis]|nr:ribonuclease Z [Aerococcus suis]
MKLHFLGTGAGVPSKPRNVSSLMLKLLDESNEMWMFDCGEATQQQILRTTLKPRKVSKIFITHLHGDHVYGLPGFLSSRSFQGGDEKLTIYGPKGIKNYIETSLKITGTTLGYPLEIIELDKKGVAFENKQYRVTYDTLVHAVPTYGFRIEESDHPGELLVDKAHEAGVPNGPLLGRLKNRETITLEDGTVLDGNDFIGEDKPGRRVTILGDTRYCTQAVNLAQDVDVLVHEATFEAGEEKMARNYYHSTAAQAAQVAHKAHVKQLYLNHISARYVGNKAKQLQKDARLIFKSTDIVYDFDEFEIE